MLSRPSLSPPPFASPRPLRSSLLCSFPAALSVPPCSRPPSSFSLILLPSLCPPRPLLPLPFHPPPLLTSASLFCPSSLLRPPSLSDPLSFFSLSSSSCGRLHLFVPRPSSFPRPFVLSSTRSLPASAASSFVPRPSFLLLVLVGLPSRVLDHPLPSFICSLFSLAAPSFLLHCSSPAALLPFLFLFLPLLVTFCPWPGTLCTPSLPLSFLLSFLSLLPFSPRLRAPRPSLVLRVCVTQTPFSLLRVSLSPSIARPSSVLCMRLFPLRPPFPASTFVFLSFLLARALVSIPSPTTLFPSSARDDPFPFLSPSLCRRSFPSGLHPSSFFDLSPLPSPSFPPMSFFPCTRLSLPSFVLSSSPPSLLLAEARCWRRLPDERRCVVSRGGVTCSWGAASVGDVLVEKCSGACMEGVTCKGSHTTSPASSVSRSAASSRSSSGLSRSSSSAAARAHEPRGAQRARAPAWPGARRWRSSRAGHGARRSGMTTSQWAGARGAVKRTRRWAWGWGM
ncbi:hypothetical protein FB451DRAFT_681206 [Mycena latifolia]|nr:hypothetical protein FB451DRAFT_681206 [Mycena latifolia]